MISEPASSLQSRVNRARLPGIVDGGTRFTYAEWYRRISALVAAFETLGLKQGDHLVTALQNRWEAATIHWACQFAGIIITPVNWRAKFDEIDFFIENAEAKGIVYEQVSADAVAQSEQAKRGVRIAVDIPQSKDVAFSALIEGAARTPSRVRAPMRGR